MSYGILIDLTKCIGCEACINACREINELNPAEEEKNKLSANSWSVIDRQSNVNIKRQCMHCLDPTCASACPVGALSKTKEGAVTYDSDKCIGCRYCIMACPFEIPTYEWDSVLPTVKKCIMCYDKRVAKGGQPACTSVCPTGATLFGERQALVDTAFHRIEDNPGIYVDHVYGLHEAGGTSVLYLSDVPFEKLGFKKAQKDVAYPKLTWQVLSNIPNIASVGGALMFGTWWVINRRMTLDREREEKLFTKKTNGDNNSAE